MDYEEELRKFLATMARGNEYVAKRNDCLYHEGDTAKAAYLLISGELRLTRKSPSGKQRLITRVQAGELIGASSLIIDGWISRCSAFVETDTAILIKIIIEHIDEMAIENNALKNLLLCTLSRRLQNSYRRIFFLS